MKLDILFTTIFLLIIINISGQNRTDFDILVGNSIEKLYEDPDLGLKYSSKISVRDDQHYEKIIVKNILTQAYYLKGNYVDAVKIALENMNSADHDQKKDQFLIKMGVIQCFQEVSLYEQSEILLASVLKDFNLKTVKTYRLAKVYQLHAYNLFALKKYDKALESLTLSNNHIQVSSPKSYILTCENKIMAGRIYVQKMDYKTAERYFQEALDLLNAHPGNNYLLSTIYMNQSDILFGKKTPNDANLMLEKALEKIKSGDFLILKNRIYSRLAQNNLVLKEKAKHIEYQQKYDDSQNIIDENRREAIRNIMKLNQGFQTQSYNSYTTKRQQEIYVSLGTASFIMILILFFNYQERQKKKMLEKQILFLENQTLQFARKEIAITPPLNTTSKKPLWIPKEKEDQLLQKLRVFEESDQFLAKNMSLPLLAAQLETNTKYLSEIIKKFKGKNFNTYINELKINHIAQLISSDITFRQYKISYLAEFTGFTSHSTFTTVFKSVTGMSPNEYIQQVNKRQIK